MTAAPPPLPEAAYAAALGAVLGPRALWGLLAPSCPSEVWGRLRAGACGDARAAAAARRLDVAAHWAAHRAAGVGATWVGADGYPPGLADDPAAPGVLFHRGDPGALGSWPRVAVVGTRRATRYGLSVSAQLGAELTVAGVSVVSGLALGIDGAAHEGACAGRATGTPGAAPPVGVVAAGLDRPYPARHAGLWGRVAGAGVLVSTAAVGTPAGRGRFPQRDRLIAALAHVVVVVESHHAGGSLHTAHEALQRGALVGAVPGSIRSPASAGTNDLLADGAFPVRDVTDVQAALGLTLAGTPRGRGRTDRDRRGGPGDTPAPAPVEATAALVLEALGPARCSLDQLLRHTGLDRPALCAVLEELSADGRVVGGGGFWERAGGTSPEDLDKKG